ncbi:hypothetical protein DFH09DRAFT_981209 [Mycena vulgaris]|nr:hypothetical protein DFH09DRAFT_981209 [Mycena vulgaris]
MSVSRHPAAQPLLQLDPAVEKQVLELLRSHTRLAQYDAELGRLRAHVNSVVVRRAALQAHCDNYGSLLAPIRKLPAEILVRIFELCRQFEDDSLPSAADAGFTPSNRPPCSPWRRCATYGVPSRSIRLHYGTPLN